MAGYSDITATLIREAQTREDALPIRNDNCRSQFFLQPQSASKVCLFFHGFTAAPFQLKSLAEALFSAGYSVLIPRLPGHGQAGAWWRDQPPPLPTQPQDYQRFALAWLRQAQMLGDRVVIGGLGGGATLAAGLALDQPQDIDRAILISPYLSSSGKVIDSFVRRVDSYYEWLLEPQHPAVGYSGFMPPALQVFLNFGKTAPLFMISSENDISVGNAEQRTLFEAAVKQQPHCWYHCFNDIPDIPHLMLTTADSSHYQDRLFPLVRDYLDSSLTWAEVTANASKS
jgi:pimeloyl-ACP methyl ester carboxylesterase